MELCLPAHCGHVFTELLCGGFWPCLLVVAIFSLDFCAVDSVPKCSLWPYFHWIAVRWILSLNAHCGHIFIGFLCGGFWPCLLVVAIFSLDCCAVDSVPECSLWPCFLSGSCAFSACSVTSLVSECWCIPLRYVLTVFSCL